MEVPEHVPFAFAVIDDEQLAARCTGRLFHGPEHP